MFKLLSMNKQVVTGAALSMSHPLFTVAANAVGVAKTGTAIGTLHGAAHTSAMAAWVGFGSMKIGMFVMGALPVIGAVMLLDGLCSRDHSVPLVDWYEEFWKKYEVDAELEALKKTVTPDPNHQLRTTTTAASLAQLNNQFRNLAVEDELYKLKKKMGLI